MKQKKRLSRRFMALLLTAVLVLGSLSLSAFAETSGDTAEAASEGTSAVADTDDDTETDYIGSSSYYYQSVSFVDDDVSTYTSSNTDDYSWSTSATSDYYEMSGYYYLSSSVYYQVYYKVTLDSEGAITDSYTSQLETQQELLNMYVAFEEDIMEQWDGQSDVFSGGEDYTITGKYKNNTEYTLSFMLYITYFDDDGSTQVKIPGCFVCFEPPVRKSGATVPEKGSHRSGE